MLCRATQDGQLIVNNFNKIWSPGGGNDNPLQYSYVENPMDSMKRQKAMTLEDEPQGQKVSHILPGKNKAVTNSSRKNEVDGPKQEQCTVEDVFGGESKARCCKDHYCIRTWNVRSMNQGKLDMVMQKIARVNSKILAN